MDYKSSVVRAKMRAEPRRDPLSEHVTLGKDAEEAADGLPERSASPRLDGGRRKPKRKIKGSPLLPEQEIEPAMLLEVPLQAHSLISLSTRDRAKYHRAHALLASGEGVWGLLKANLPLTGLGMYEALLAQSWSLRFNNPSLMVRLAEAATEVAQRMSPRRYGTKRVADLLARALGELANAYRIADRLQSAQKAFGQAYAIMQKGTGDAYLKARLFDLEASLLGKWREFPLALTRLMNLSEIYQELGEPHLAGRAFIIRALYTFYNGNPEEALTLNQEGINLIDHEHDSALFLQALHNHLIFLVDLRQFGPAKRLLFESRQHFVYKDHVSALRLRGTEGRINYGLGELVSAEMAFRESKDGFRKIGLAFAAAIACLDLAMVLMTLNKKEEALSEVVTARDIFLQLEIYREYLGSVIFLEEAFHRNKATAKLIENTTDHIQRKWLQVGPARMQ
jgi:tetratricopeptide (TPR) repeat protein